MTKTPYEIRLELIKLAQDQLNQKYFQQYNTAMHNASIANTALNEVPEFPSTQQILNEAETLKAFIDRQ